MLMHLKNAATNTGSIESYEKLRRMVRRGFQKNQPHVYECNEKVLVRLKDKQNNIPRRHYATKGHVIKPYLVLQRYKIRFQSPNNSEHIVKWLSVNYVTSITREKEIHHNASQLQYHQRKYHIPIIHDDRLNTFSHRDCHIGWTRDLTVTASLKLWLISCVSSVFIVLRKR